MKKRYLSLILSLAMIVMMFAGLTISADAASGNWKDYTASAFAGGTGTIVAQGANTSIITSTIPNTRLSYTGHTLSRTTSGSPIYVYISA